MSIEIAIWRIDEDSEPVPLGGMGYESRLQQVIADDLWIVDPSPLVIGREVATSYGRRIDILAVDAMGNLVVIELKRDPTPRDVVAQVLDYGSWVRNITTEEIANIFIEYQIVISARKPRRESMKPYRADSIASLMNSIPLIDSLSLREKLTRRQRRIVSYLREEYEVDINVVFFRAFQDGDRRYLTRAWLADPTSPSEIPSRTASKGEWNGEFYVCFGEEPHRRWNDAMKYGFVSAGGGDRYVRPLRTLQPGNRVWVSIPGRGYVGVERLSRR